MLSSVWLPMDAFDGWSFLREGLCTRPFIVVHTVLSLITERVSYVHAVLALVLVFLLYPDAPDCLVVPLRLAEVPAFLHGGGLAVEH